MTKPSTGFGYQFGPFRLDPSAFRLWRDASPVALAPKAFDLLQLLVGRPSLMVSKETIMQELWRDVAVTDNALTQVVSDLRRALGDAPGSPTYIETVPRRGFRFIAAVQPITDDSAASASPANVASHQSINSRAGVRETSSLEAYRAFTDGRIRLEGMDPADVPEAIKDFARAIALDARYAAPHVGLAHARYWLFEASRARNRPDVAQLSAAIQDLHRAIDLDPGFAEAHAALAMMLTSAWRTEEAVAAGRRAVGLEPGNWRNYCRFGVAAWGEERIVAFEQVLALYPAFAYAYYGIAMVHVARNDLDVALRILGKGIPFQDRQTGRGDRYPANGLHWLLGLVHLTRGETELAHEEFDRELATGGAAVYATEFAVNALDGHGFALLHEGRAEEAAHMFGKALAVYPDRVRSLVGLAVAHQRQGRIAAQLEALRKAESSVGDLESSDRRFEGMMALSLVQAGSDSPLDAMASLERLLATAPTGYAGWTIPLEPVFRSMFSAPSFHAVLGRLAARAR